MYHCGAVASCAGMSKYRLTLSALRKLLHCHITKLYYSKNISIAMI